MDIQTQIAEQISNADFNFQSTQERLNVLTSEVEIEKEKRKSILLDEVVQSLFSPDLIVEKLAEIDNYTVPELQALQDQSDMFRGRSLRLQLKRVNNIKK